MSTRRLLPADVYIPNGGLNKDANALTIAQNQFNGVENLRVLPYEVRLRDGSRQIASNVPGGDPILHFHTFKQPNAEEEVFAFTKQAIFKMNQGTGTWEVAMPKLSHVVGGTVIGALTDVDYNDLFVNSNGIFCQMDSNTNRTTFEASGTAAFRYVPTSAMDLSTYTKILCQRVFVLNCDYGAQTYTQTGNWTVDFCTDTAGAVVAGSSTIDLVDVGGYLQFMIWDMPTTGTFTSIRSMVFRMPQYTSATPGHWYMDLQITPFSSASSGFIFFNNAGLSEISFWSTTSFVDLTLGNTIVAAASQPSAPTDDDSDGGLRKLLYYDSNPAHAYFVSYTPRTTTASGNIATSHDGGGVSIGPFSGTLSNVPLVPFTIFFQSGGLRIVDDGSGHFGGDGSGTIDYTTGVYMIQFTSGVGLVNTTYYYYTTTTKAPRFVTNYNNRIIYANIYEDSLYQPWRIRWSDVGDLRSVRGSSYRDLLDDDISPISAIAYSGEYLVIYRNDSVVKMRYIGGDNIFGFYTVWQYGTFASRTILEWNNMNFLLGKDDVYKFDGNQFISIATQRVRNAIFSRLNKSKIINCFSSYDDQYKEYWLWVVTSGNTFPTEVYVYSMQYDTWTMFTFPEISAVGNYYVLAATTIDQLVGTIDQQNWRFNEGVLEGTIRVPLLAKYNGNVFVIDYRIGHDFVGSADEAVISWYLITKDFMGKDLPFKDRTQRVHFEASGDSVDVGISGKYTQDPSAFDTIYTISLTGEYLEHQYWPDKVHEHIRLLFKGVGSFSLRWVQLFQVREEKD